MALSLTTKASSSLLLKRFSINLLQTFNFSTTQNPNSSTTSTTTSDASEKPKPKKKRKKNLFDVAQFLPNWGIGCHLAKKHWKNVSYEITKINLSKSGGHGKAWGLAYVNGLPAPAPKKISGVHKRCWTYIPNPIKLEAKKTDEAQEA